MTSSNRTRALIAAARIRIGERKAVGLPDPPDVFGQIEAEQTSAAISRYIDREYGSFERLEAELERELTGEAARTAEEMMAHLCRQAEG